MEESLLNLLKVVLKFSRNLVFSLLIENSDYSNSFFQDLQNWRILYFL